MDRRCPQSLPARPRGRVTPDSVPSPETCHHPLLSLVHLRGTGGSVRRGPRGGASELEGGDVSFAGGLTRMGEAAKVPQRALAANDNPTPAEAEAQKTLNPSHMGRRLDVGVLLLLQCLYNVIEIQTLALLPSTVFPIWSPKRQASFRGRRAGAAEGFQLAGLLPFLCLSRRLQVDLSYISLATATGPPGEQRNSAQIRVALAGRWGDAALEVPPWVDTGERDTQGLFGPAREEPLLFFPGQVQVIPSRRCPGGARCGEQQGCSSMSGLYAHLRALQGRGKRGWARKLRGQSNSFGGRAGEITHRACKNTQIIRC